MGKIMLKVTIMLKKVLKLVAKSDKLLTDIIGNEPLGTGLTMRSILYSGLVSVETQTTTNVHRKPVLYSHVNKGFLTKAHLMTIIVLMSLVENVCISTSSDVMVAFLEIQERWVTVMCI